MQEQTEEDVHKVAIGHDVNASNASAFLSVVDVSKYLSSSDKDGNLCMVSSGADDVSVIKPNKAKKSWRVALHEFLYEVIDDATSTPDGKATLTALTTRTKGDVSAAGTTGGLTEIPSLSEAYESVNIPQSNPNEHKVVSCFRKLSAFVGPGYMVAVGYMDPGNWSTDIAGGAQFKYSLLFVVFLSSILAIFLQVLTAKLGIVGKRDLAQQCRATFPRMINKILWLTAEAAIAATDLAEVIGSAIALQLLFSIPLVAGVILTALDVLIILGVGGGPQKFRFIELLVFLLIMLILVSFAVELALSKPSASLVLSGMFVPDETLVTNSDKLYIAMGILGATIMPHNLYLHSSIVQTRKIENTVDAKREALYYSSLDTIVALLIALFVNASILMVAAAAFFNTEGFTPTISEAYHMLAPSLGTRAASILFGLALLASGQNSTLTGTLAGQIVMEGFVEMRLKPWVRRLATRLTVIVPAVVVVVITGERGIDALLTLSQVFLSIQLPFAVLPLIYFTSNKTIMGPDFANRLPVQILGWAIGFLFVGLNTWLLLQMIMNAAQG